MLCTIACECVFVRPIAPHHTCPCRVPHCVYKQFINNADIAFTYYIISTETVSNYVGRSSLLLRCAERTARLNPFQFIWILFNIKLIIVRGSGFTCVRVHGNVHLYVCIYALFTYFKLQIFFLENFL